MSSPFPGMNPYLEQPAFWSSFHSRLIVAIADALAPQLRPKYYIEVETRSYLSTLDEDLLIGIPDGVVLAAKSPVDPPYIREAIGVATQSRPRQVTVPMPTEVKERYLEVREVGTEAVITVIEVLSPKNKRRGDGREAYEAKRSKVLGSLSHLIEIDLLRGGEPMLMKGEAGAAYRILVSRTQKRPIADLYEFGLQDSIPNFPLPLKSEDAEPIVELQQIFAGVYERASYDLRLDYRQPLPPPDLSEVDRSWLDTVLAPLRQNHGATEQ